MSSLASLSDLNLGRDDSFVTKKTKSGTNVELDRINQQIQVYTTKIQCERKRLESINESIIQHEVKAKSRVETDYSMDIRTSKIDSERKIYIDRLNKKLVSLNTKISQNKELRRKIDDMKHERSRYDEVYTSLERGIQSQSKKMAKVLEDGRKAIRLKDKASQDLEALTKQLEENSNSLQAETAELRKLEEQFQDDKDEQVTIERRMSQPPTTASQKTKTASHESQGEGEELDDEKALDIALAKVRDATGIRDVDQLIKRIVQTEEHQYSIFSRIAELDAAEQELQTKIADAEQELQRVQRSLVSNDTQTKKKASLLEERRDELEDKIREAERKALSQINTWENICSRILTVHNALDISVPEDLVGNNGVNESNVWDFLAAIEHKTSEILKAVQGDDDDQESELLASPSDNHLKRDNSDVFPKVQVPQMELPSATDAVDGHSDLDYDDGERPFTMKELQESLRMECAEKIE